MATEKFLRHIFWPVRQQSDTQEIFLFREVNRMLEKSRTVTLALELFVDHQVFEQDNETAFSRADGEEQIDHANNGPVPPQHEHASSAGLLED